MATVFVTVAIIIVAMTAIFFTTIGVVAWFVKSFFITYFLFFFLLVVFHVMKGAKCVYQFLSPQCTEGIFLFLVLQFATAYTLELCSFL